VYPGYITIGTEDPFMAGQQLHEIVNNQRAYSYAENAGICWIHECDTCPEALIIMPGAAGGFVSPVADPAPWYTASNPDSGGFLGVIGIEVTGAENSTRQATVTMGLTGGGVIGPTYMGPRTIVVRAIAIALDECALQYGLTWLRAQYATMVSACEGDPMTFFDCCPCVCQEETSPRPNPCWAVTYRELRLEPACDPDYWPDTYGDIKEGPPDDSEWSMWPETYFRLDTGPPPWVASEAGPCWAESYLELRTEPACDPDYWPETYGDIKVGPPPESDEWCAWPNHYYTLKSGPPPWSCCAEACVVPYVRQFKNVRVTEGPTILQHPVMHSKGAMAEIEFTIVCADPIQYSLPYVIPNVGLMHGEVLFDDPPPPVPTPYHDPWALPELVPG
jgi:hypothetical protein